MPDEVNLLDQLRLATPCGVPWERMSGDDRSRTCDKCKLNVYNLTGMIPLEAEQFLTERESSNCTRIYRRVDGSILAKDCPRGIRRARLATVAVIGIAAMFLLAMEQYGDHVRIWNTESYDITRLEPFAWFRPQQTQQYGPGGQFTPYVFGQPASTGRVMRHGSQFNWNPPFSASQPQGGLAQPHSLPFSGSTLPSYVPSQEANTAWENFEKAMKTINQQATSPTTQPAYHAGDNLIP